MKLRVDPRLEDEAERFRFRFRCDDCCHFREDGARCGEGWDPREHRAVLAPGQLVVFCKEFEMGP